MYVGEDEVDGLECAIPGHEIVVHTSINGVDWKTSRIELPIPDSSTPSRCYSVYVGSSGGMAAGPQGIMITALIQGEITSDDPNVAKGIEKRYAWFSPDGQTWSQLDASGPLDGGEIDVVVATPDGFVATSTSSRFLWETTDGTTWIQKSSLSDSRQQFGSPRLGVWDGRIVDATGDGVWTIEDTPQELIASNGTSGLGVIEIGEFGLVAIPSEMDGGGTEVLFSANGTTWNRWTPPEFGPEGTVYVVGIGDDFVVLRLATETGVSHWVGRLP